MSKRTYQMIGDLENPITFMGDEAWDIEKKLRAMGRKLHNTVKARKRIKQQNNNIANRLRQQHTNRNITASNIDANRKASCDFRVAYQGRAGVCYYMAATMLFTNTDMLSLVEDSGVRDWLMDVTNPKKFRYGRDTENQWCPSTHPAVQKEYYNVTGQKTRVGGYDVVLVKSILKAGGDHWYLQEFWDHAKNNYPTLEHADLGIVELSNISLSNSRSITIADMKRLIYKVEGGGSIVFQGALMTLKAPESGHSVVLFPCRSRAGRFLKFKLCNPQQIACTEFPNPSATTWYEGGANYSKHLKKVFMFFMPEQPTMDSMSKRLVNSVPPLMPEQTFKNVIKVGLLNFLPTVVGNRAKTTWAQNSLSALNDAAEDKNLLNIWIKLQSQMSEESPAAAAQASGLSHNQMREEVQREIFTMGANGLIGIWKQKQLVKLGKLKLNTNVDRKKMENMYNQMKWLQGGLN